MTGFKGNQEFRPLMPSSSIQPRLMPNVTLSFRRKSSGFGIDLSSYFVGEVASQKNLTMSFD
jgi:hypothetical protein